MERLIARAEAMGLRVQYRDLGRVAGYLYGSGLVVLNHRRSDLTQRVTLAHEMGHWHHGHRRERGHDSRRDEMQADQFAARVLVTAREYARAERLVGEHPGALAKELGVTRALVELRRRDLERDRRILATVEAWRDEWSA